MFFQAQNTTPAGSHTPLHVELIWDDFERRRARNPRFSLRAYSRYLGVDPSSMSRILNGKEEISLATCITVLRKLALDDDQKQRFLDSVIEDRRMKMIQLLRQGVFGAPASTASPVAAVAVEQQKAS